MSKVSCSPIGSIDATSSHQTSDVASACSPSVVRRLRQLADERRASSPRDPTCQLWLRGRPVAALTSAQGPAPFAARTASQTPGGTVSTFVPGPTLRSPATTVASCAALAARRDRLAERPEPILAGDEHLARDLVRAVVHRARAASGCATTMPSRRSRCWTSRASRSLIVE